MEIEGIVLITSSLSLRGALTHNDVNEQSPCLQATSLGFFTRMSKPRTPGKTVQIEECGGGLVKESSFARMSLESGFERGNEGGQCKTVRCRGLPQLVEEISCPAAASQLFIVPHL